MYSINKKMPEKIRKYYINPVAEGLVLACLALFLTAITSFFIYHHALNAIKIEIKDGLLRTVSGIAACLDGDLIASFDSPEKKDLPEYLATVALLQKARLATKHCTYLYINSMNAGSVVFLVDPTPIDENGKPIFVDEKNLAPSVPMTKYDNPSQELLLALASQTTVITAEPYYDGWGTFFSAYVPIYNARKQFVGTLGADLRINDMLARCQPIEDATKRAFFVSVSLSLLCGTLIWFTRRFCLQLNESRFTLLENLLSAKEFADQTSFIIGNQLNRTAKLLQNISGHLEVMREKPKEEIAQLLRKEQIRLSSLAEKILAVSELKCGKSQGELGTFKVAEIIKNLQSKLQGSCENHKCLVIDVDKAAPTEMFGSILTYEELLVQMGQFFLKMFQGTIQCRFSMLNEGTKEIVLNQSMQADVSGIDKRRMELLQTLCGKEQDSDFFAEIELAEAVAVPIVRELIYLLNSDIHLQMNNSQFSIAFEATFQKVPEAQEKEEEEG